MRRLALFSSATLFLLGGCVLVGTYDYDNYGDNPVGAGGSVSSSSSAGGGGSGGVAGMGGEGGSGGPLAPCPPGFLDAGIPEGGTPDGGTVAITELCNNGFDDDCAGDGDCSVKAEWSGQFGDNFNQRLRAAHSNNSGDVVFSGEFQGTLNFGGSKLLQNAAGYQPYAVRLNSNGDAIFVHGVAGLVGSAKGVVLRDENIVMVGEYASKSDPVNKKTIFVRKVTPAGNFGNPVGQGWHVNLGDDEENRGVGIATTIAANAPLFVAAKVRGSATVSGSAKCMTFVGNNGTAIDAVILALNSSNGSCTWPAQITNATPTAIVASTTTVIVVGFYQGKINGSSWPDAQETMGNMSTGSFIAAYNADTGVEKWHKTFIASGMNQTLSFSEATLDPLGNVAVAGVLAGKWDIAGHMYSSSESATSADIIVASFNGATGEVRWADRFGGTGPQLANSIAQWKGQIIVGGKTTAAMAIQNDADTGPLCMDSTCMFLLSIDDATGTPVWGRAFGGKEPSGAGNETRLKLATNTSALWLASSWSTPLDFGKGLLQTTNAGIDEDIFLAKFTSLP